MSKLRAELNVAAIVLRQRVNCLLHVTGDEKKVEAKASSGGFMPKLSNNPLSKLRSMLSSQDQGPSGDAAKPEPTDVTTQPENGEGNAEDDIK